MTASTFRSSAAGSAWWVARGTDGQRYKLSTNAYTFVRLVQHALKINPLLRTSVMSFDGNAASSADLVEDGNWGPITSRLLYNWLSATGWPGAEQVAGELRFREIGTYTIAPAMILAASSLGGFSNPLVPNGTPMPLYGVRSPGSYLGSAPSIGPASSSDIAQVDAIASTPPASTPASTSTSTPASTRSTDIPGSTPPPGLVVDQYPGSTPPPGLVVDQYPYTPPPAKTSNTDTTGGTPLSQIPSTVTVGSGIPWATVGIVGAIVIVAGVLALSLSSAAPKHSLAPAHATARVARRRGRRR